MKLVKLATASFSLALVAALAISALGRHFEESAQDRKIDEICAVITEEVQTGSMAKASESARTLFSFTFPENPVSVQIKEQNTIYGVAPSDQGSEAYRLSECSIEARSDVSVLFYLAKQSLISKKMMGTAFLLGCLFTALALAAAWLTKKISSLAQTRFNLELRSALGLSTDLPKGGLVSRSFDFIVRGVGSGQNLRDSVEGLKEKITEQNREALALRESQMVTDLELKKNEKFIEVVRQVRHDIRSPLQSLMVLSGKDVSSSVAQRQVTGVISFIQGMIEDLETKEEMADQSGNGERLHIAEALIKEVIHQKRLIFQATDIELKINSDFLSVVRVQPHHFRRVIGNLLQNAFEAIGGAHRERGLIRIETSKANDMVHIQITDNGKGISPGVQEKLFTSGFTFGKQNGSGLGLSHAKSCVLRWGGNIALESQEGKGTTVKISLPMALQDAQFVAQIPYKGVRVSVVVDDDHEDFARVQKAIPGPAVHCSSFKEFEDWRALSFDQDGVQFVFDYNLGEPRSGLEVLVGVGSKIPRVLSTNDYDSQDVIAASRGGIYVLPKVFLA